MAGETSFDRNSMATAATQVEEALAQIRGLQSRLNGSHADMMGGWKGVSASAFTAAFDEFNADFSKVIYALDGIQEKLIGSRVNYNASEEANTVSVNRIASTLNR